MAGQRCALVQLGAMVRAEGRGLHILVNAQAFKS